MLKLLLCLSNKLHFYISEFEQDNLDVAQLAKTLKRCLVTVGSYVFKTSKQSKSSIEYFDQYDEIDKLLALPAQSEGYQEKLMTPIEFKASFLIKNTEFHDNIKWSPELRQQFFSTASAFFKVAIKQIKERLPTRDSPLILADAFLLNTKEDIETIRRLGFQFRNVIPPNEITKFDSELEALSFHSSDIKEK